MGNKFRTTDQADFINKSQGKPVTLITPRRAKLNASVETQKPSDCTGKPLHQADCATNRKRDIRAKPIR